MKKNDNHRYAVLAICCCLVIIVIGLALTLPGGSEIMQEQSSGMEELMQGAASGDGNAAAEGGRRLLSATLADLKNILIMFAVVLAISLIAVGIIRIFRRLHRNRVTREDEEDDNGET